MGSTDRLLAAGGNRSARAGRKEAATQTQQLAAVITQASMVRDAHLVALVNAQLETNRLLAAVLVRLGGQP